MDKRTEPKGVRFKYWVYETLKEIAATEDTTFSEIIESFLEESIQHYRYHHPSFKFKNTPIENNGQVESGSTLLSNGSTLLSKERRLIERFVEDVRALSKDETS
jgi:hypothetical protein